MNSYSAPFLAGGMGLLWAGAFLAYAKAFTMTGTPTLSLPYFIRLAFTTPFLPGLGLALIASFLRMWLFNQIGAQRTWFLEFVMLMVSTLVVVSVLREGMKTTQCIGALAVILGMFLLLRK